LQAIIGAQNPNPFNGFTGAALYILGSGGQNIESMPSLSRLRDINGTTILQNLALVNLTDGLQVPPPPCLPILPGPLSNTLFAPFPTSIQQEFCCAQPMCCTLGVGQDCSPNPLLLSQLLTSSFFCRACR